MILKELTSYLESIAPLALQEDYDNAGLIVGSSDMEISNVLVNLDCTEAVVEEAIKTKANLIISHHPIIFKGLKKLTGKTYVERVVMKAIRHNIALYAMHTNLDHVLAGVNAKICEKLSLKNARILSPKKRLLKKLITFCPVKESEKVRNALFSAGAGQIGNYSECSFNGEGFGTFKGNESTNPFAGSRGKQHQEPELRIETIYPAYFEDRILSALLKAHPYEEVAYDLVPLSNPHPQVGSGMTGEFESPMPVATFMSLVKRRLKTSCIRHTSLVHKEIKRVAVCGGSGSFLLNEAINAECQVFITGDFTYHRFFDAEGKIIITDVGHYESEQFTSELLLEKIQKKFPTFAVRLSKVNTNPVHYL